MAFGLRKPREDASGDNRRGERHDMHITGTIRLGSSEMHEVTVENLSTTGFRALIPADLEPGTVFRIGLVAGRARHARVVWREGDTFGCEFLAPLNSADVVG